MWVVLRFLLAGSKASVYSWNDFFSHKLIDAQNYFFLKFLVLCTIVLINTSKNVDRPHFGDVRFSTSDLNLFHWPFVVLLREDFL